MLRRLDARAKKLRLLWLDGGCFNAFEQAHKQRLELRPALRPPEHKGFALLPLRWVIERTFTWLTITKHERSPARPSSCSL